MSTLKFLQSVRFVVDEKGQPAAVQIDIDAWEGWRSQHGVDLTSRQVRRLAWAGAAALIVLLAVASAITAFVAR